MRAPDFIHRYVPPWRGSPRTLLLLHETDGDENDLMTLGGEVAPDAGLLSPRGAAAEWRGTEPPKDAEELRRRTEKLADFVRWAAEEYGFDPTGVLAVGRANGASVAASVLVHRPETLAGGALLYATIPDAPDAPPSLWGKRVFLGGLENDPQTPVEETTRLHTMLNRFGAEVRTAWFSRDGRSFEAEARAIAAWIGS